MEDEEESKEEVMRNVHKPGQRQVMFNVMSDSHADAQSASASASAASASMSSGDADMNSWNNLANGPMDTPTGESQMRDL